MTLVMSNRGKLISEQEWVSLPLEGNSTITSANRLRSESPEKIFGSEYTPTPTQADTVTIRAKPRVRTRIDSMWAKMHNLLTLEPDWDSYGAEEIRPAAILHAVRLLAAILNADESIPDPIIVPTSDGGVMLEWDQDDVYLELQVKPSNNIEFYWERPDGQSKEAVLQNDQASLHRLLQRLR